MIEVDATSDPVRLGFLTDLLRSAGLDVFVADSGAASLWGTAIPARILVADADAPQARRLIEASDPDR